MIKDNTRGVQYVAMINGKPHIVYNDQHQNSFGSVYLDSTILMAFQNSKGDDYDYVIKPKRLSNKLKSALEAGRKLGIWINVRRDQSSLHGKKNHVTYTQQQYRCEKKKYWRAAYFIPWDFKKPLYVNVFNPYDSELGVFEHWNIRHPNIDVTFMVGDQYGRKSKTKFTPQTIYVR